MDIQYFPHFIRTNYTNAKIEDTVAIEIGCVFKSYLEKKLCHNQKLLNEISNNNPTEVIKKNKDTL